MKIKANIISLTLLLLSIVSFSLAQDDKPKAKVRGRVTNYFGSILPDEEVKFFLKRKVGGGYVSAEGQFIKSAKTDKDGNYVILNLPAGEYRVVTGSAEIWRFYLWTEANEVLDLGEYAGITHGFPQLEVTGNVKLSDKSSAKDVTVTLVNAFDETEVLRTRTDGKGNYKIKFIQPGQYILYVSKPGYAVSTTSFLINGLKGLIIPETETSKKIDVVLSTLR